METLEAIQTRKSVRAFKPDPIPGHILDRILEAAGASPSYTNSQPWEVAVVTGGKRDQLAEQLTALARAKAPATRDIPEPKNWPATIEARVREHGARRLAVLGVARDDVAGRDNLRLGNFDFYGAPCAVFLFLEATLGEWSIFDMGLFAQNLILAAHSLGVGSCLQASVTGYAPEIKKILGVAEGKKLVIGISLGYEDDKAVLNTYRGVKQSPDAFTRRYE